MSTKHKIHSATFKAKVALDAYKADKTSAELISTHKVTSGQISTWKKQLLDGAVSLFETGHPKALDATALTAPLYEEIRRLKVELDWLKKGNYLSHPCQLFRMQQEHLAKLGKGG